MVKLNNRKGAVELSLNLIIMLVIGLTVLGLIIAFVTSFLGSAEDSFKGKLSEDDKTKIDQVRRETGNFAFLSSSVRVVQGSKSPGKLYMKIRNPSHDEFTFNGGEIGTDSSFGVEISAGMIGDSSYDDSGDNKITVFGPPIALDSAESDGFSLEVYAKKEVPIGTYYAKFSIELGDETYDQVVTINVE